MPANAFTVILPGSDDCNGGLFAPYGGGRNILYFVYKRGAGAFAMLSPALRYLYLYAVYPFGEYTDVSLPYLYLAGNVSGLIRSTLSENRSTGGDYST